MRIVYVFQVGWYDTSNKAKLISVQHQITGTMQKFDGSIITIELELSHIFFELCSIRLL